MRAKSALLLPLGAALVGLTLSACGAPARLKGPAVGRHAEHGRATSSQPVRVYDADDLDKSGLPSTGNALARRLPGGK